MTNNTREELLKQRKELDLQLAELDKDKVKFSVDAGIIDRLGRELVSKQETAVAELVKNAYDADATEVLLKFINSDSKGGMLIIDDNGHGMDLKTIRNGFMRLSSTDKIHNPVSPKFNRKKAGRKGIGRFATQRLGKRLVIITQTKESDSALKVVVEWEKYKIDQDLDSVANSIEEISKQKEEGTTLTIEDLRENWTIAEIKRVFRYVSDLLQPSYLSDRVKNSDVKFGTKEDESFSVNCEKNTNGLIETISDIDTSVLQKALAIFEGFIDEDGKGYCYIESKSLGLSQTENEQFIEPSKTRYEKELWRKGIKPKRYLYLKDMQVHFKAYYFIYNRIDYYEGDGIGLSRSELKQVQNLGKTAGGIRLYRNGFKVGRYGEIGDDWLEIDQRYTGHSGRDIVPFGNKNIFGFVEIIDEEGELFQETSSREGLIKNEVLSDLVDFLSRAFQACRRRLESSVGFKERRERREERLYEERSQKERLQQLRLFIDEKKREDREKEGNNKTKFDFDEIEETINQVERDFDELAMLRVLAGMGLLIGEFVHEIRQFSPSFESDLANLSNLETDNSMKKIIERLKRNFKNFRTYSAFFDETIRNNADRKLKIIEIRDVVRDFEKIIQKNAKKNRIEIELEFVGYDLFTCPMHTSEWSSILFNLYTNAKKAILKKEQERKISIIGSEDSNKVILEFSDTGIGIPNENKERIFNAFFTTSTPVGRGASPNDELLGSGLGLKIVSDIIESYDGEIYVSNPPKGFNTCIRIELPKATEEQIKNEEHG